MANEAKTQYFTKGKGATKRESQTAKQAFVRSLARLQKEWGCPKKKRLPVKHYTWRATFFRL
jgi:hypothetical protein